MSRHKSTISLDKEINKLNLPCYETLTNLLPLLTLLEKLNPCGQEYEVSNGSVIISYQLSLNLFNFRRILPLNVHVQIIGLPVSVCLSGFFGNYMEIEKNIKQRKGLKILLNSDHPFKGGGKTLSTFVFENRFEDFNQYLSYLRSPYRRRINKALRKREKLVIKTLSRHDFNKVHYDLYLSIMSRTENPLETLPIEFFQEYDAELFEFSDRETHNVVGFIQLKAIKNKLYFLFGGFKKEDIPAYDIYYNMLLKIVETGIEKRVEEIEFGQTAEESKLKIGCREKYKYMTAHHSNPLINFFISMLLPLFSYRPYPVKHHVFKDKGEK